MRTSSKPSNFEQTAAARDAAASVWTALAVFDGPVQLFWEQYLQAVGQTLQARRVLLLVSGIGQPWRALAQWPADAPELGGDGDGVLQLISRASTDQPMLEPFTNGGHALAMPLPRAPAGPQQVVAVVALHAADFGAATSDLMAWAVQVAGLPADYARRCAVSDSAVSPAVVQDQEVTLANEPHAERLYQILRLSIQLSQQTHFLRMAYELCNALAVRFDGDRVSLGWVHPPYVRLTAISHVEKFDAQSTISRALESAMEEAADQSGELVYPQPADSRKVNRAHASYALMQGVTAVASVPLRDGDTVKGVLCLEKRQGTWSEEELWELRLMAQATVRQLADLHERGRWWGGKVRQTFKRWYADSLRPRHSLSKLAAAASLFVVLVVIFLPWPYRVDATLTLRSKDLLFMPAPFDGYLRQVHVEIGDKVEAGQVLVQLDTRDLVLEESMAEADVMRYSHEAEKAQAARQLAEMQINFSRQAQSASRLALIRHQLAHAQVTAPRAGVVVEGELKKNLGAPLRKGDLLLKLAQTDDNYLELEIDQVDVHEVKVGSTGEFALVGRPDQRFVIKLDRIDPASTLREGRNIYLARAKVQEAIPAWWRPGMGGTARIDAGDRPLIWVLTHRTVRFLRELFWL
jgi:biotin carboxyl carrier protein